MRGWFPAALVLLGIVAFLVYGSLVGSRSGAHIDLSSRPDFAPGVVDTVFDGDTIHLADGRRVRLVQIDAPEVAEEECYSKEATRALARLAPLGDTVTLRHDPVLETRDRFGRVLAYVFRGHTNLNLRVVELGAAAPYFYDGGRGRYATALLDAARAAKRERRGLWGACPGTPFDPERRIHAVQPSASEGP